MLFMVIEHFRNGEVVRVIASADASARVVPG